MPSSGLRAGLPGDLPADEVPPLPFFHFLLVTPKSTHHSLGPEETELFYTSLELNLQTQLCEHHFGEEHTYWFPEMLSS